MSNEKKFRLGKHPQKLDRRNLKFAKYLPVALPAPPPVVDRASRLRNIGMMANDQYGDCTIAAAGHMVQSWTVYAERGQQNIPDSEIVKAYLAISPQDNGAYMLDALNYWRKTGVGTDKVEAFVEVEPRNVTQAKLAIQYFGAVYIGMALPDKNTFGPWLDPVASGPGNPYNGHAVCLVAYDDSRKMFKVCTWGEIWDMSYAWYESYADEAYAVLNDVSLIQSSGVTPSGFDWNKLQTDLNHLGDPITDPVPTPEPTPTPTPDPDPVSPPEPVGPDNPVVPQPTPVDISITGVGSAYWYVYMDGALQSQHVSQFEAAQNAVNCLLKNPQSNVSIVHNAKYTVTGK